MIELPELLPDVAAWTGFGDEFTHLYDNEGRVADLTVSICAVLLVQACNVSLPWSPAPTYPRSPGSA